MSLQNTAPRPTHARDDNSLCGFLFCFKKCSGCTPQNESIPNLIIEKMVDVLTWSDLIHVEFVPVRQYCNEKNTIIMCPYSYTAFMSCGFVRKQSYDCCDRKLFTHVYVPLDNESTHRGIAFLESMVGERYNRLGMWHAFCHQFLWSAAVNGIYAPHMHKRPVFCSEAGLMLCYLVGKYNGPERPMYCTPKMLYRILQDDAGLHLRRRPEPTLLVMDA
jgi:hypothetical protein